MVYIMGLFLRKTKITQRELQTVQTALNQVKDSVALINSTTKPDVFFKRLHFTLDILLFLQEYEKYKIFNNSLPSKDFNKIIKNLDATVNDFIDRASNECKRKIAGYKTQKAKIKCFEDFSSKMISAFDCADSFWEGNGFYPHYTGILFTESNYQKVQSIFDLSCNIDTLNF